MAEVRYPQPEMKCAVQVQRMGLTAPHLSPEHPSLPAMPLPPALPNSRAPLLQNKATIGTLFLTIVCLLPFCETQVLP